MSGLRWPHFVALVLGLAFLHVPILTLIAYSFNESKLVTVWGGFSLRWYAALWHDAQFLDSAALSLKLAAVSATLATVLGTLAALALARLRPFPGGALLSVMAMAPLVMPEVITGLSLLLLFVALEWERGFWTLVAAHVTLTLAFVTVVVRSRLARFDTRLEEAAADLGAPPWRVFASITLPLILPAVVSGWLLAFALSLDDLVIATFATGPGATTLPMRIYSAVRLGVSPEINAASSLLVGIVAVAVGTTTLMSRGKE